MVDTRKYAVYRRSLKPKSIVVGYPSKARAASTVDYGLQQAGGSSDSVSRPAISPAFKDFHFYPERREGRGPAYVKTALDLSYAVSSKIICNELARGGRIDEKGQDKIKAKKRKVATSSKGTGNVKAKKSTGGAAKSTGGADCSKGASTMKHYFPVRPKSKPPLSQQAHVRDSSSSELDIEDEVQECAFVLVDQAPTQFCWVGVRATSSYTLNTGRETRQRNVKIGKITRIVEKSCRVDFLEQLQSGLWVKSGSGSYDVSLDDVIVIQPGVSVESTSDNAVSAYELPRNIVNIVRSFFKK